MGIYYLVVVTGLSIVSWMIGRWISTVIKRLDKKGVKEVISKPSLIETFDSHQESICSSFFIVFVAFVLCTFLYCVVYESQIGE